MYKTNTEQFSAEQFYNRFVASYEKLKQTESTKENLETFFPAIKEAYLLLEKEELRSYFHDVVNYVATDKNHTLATILETKKPKTPILASQALAVAQLHFKALDLKRKDVTLVETISNLAKTYWKQNK